MKHDNGWDGTELLMRVLTFLPRAFLLAAGGWCAFQGLRAFRAGPSAESMPATPYYALAGTAVLVGCGVFVAGLLVRSVEASGRLAVRVFGFGVGAILASPGVALMFTAPTAPPVAGPVLRAVMVAMAAVGAGFMFVSLFCRWQTVWKVTEYVDF